MLCEEEGIALPIQHKNNISGTCKAYALHNQKKKRKKIGKAYENFKTLLYFLLLSKGKVVSFLYISILIVPILEEVTSASCHHEENYGCFHRALGRYLQP